MNKKTAYFYDRFSIFYPLVDLFLKPQKRRLFREINRLPHGKLLEIGVGNGSHFGYYKIHKIVGIDTSPKMLKEAHKHKKENIELLQMSGERLSFDEEVFDYVVLSHVLAVAGNPEKMMDQVFRVLKPSGQVFILNHFTPENWLRYVDHFFNRFSGLFHFRSAFYISDIRAFEKFTLLQEISFGKLSYFKLLIYQKR